VSQSPWAIVWRDRTF